MFEKLAWTLGNFDFKLALLSTVSTVDRLLVVVFGDSSARMPSDLWDLPGILTGSFTPLFLKSGEDLSRSSSCIEGMIRSGSALARADVRDVLLRGVSDEVEDRWDFLTASARVGLAELDVAGGGVV